MTETKPLASTNGCRADEGLRKPCFKAGLQDPKGTINTILAAWAKTGICPVSRKLLSRSISLPDDEHQQWLIKAEAGLWGLAVGLAEEGPEEEQRLEMERGWR